MQSAGARSMYQQTTQNSVLQYTCIEKLPLPLYEAPPTQNAIKTIFPWAVRSTGNLATECNTIYRKRGYNCRVKKLHFPHFDRK